MVTALKQDNALVASAVPLTGLIATALKGGTDAKS
jgi:hypothetical protein